MRAFLAFDIPEDIKSYLQTVIRDLSARMEGVKWVRDDGLHITLKFFGEIEEARILRIREALSLIGFHYSPFVTALRTIDAFPNKRIARVVVVTLGDNLDTFRGIFDDIEEGLSTMGVEKERRGLTPHVTLGRREYLGPILDRDMMKLEQKSFLLDRLVLFQSTLTREGAHYTPRWEIRLGGVVT